MESGGQLKGSESIYGEQSSSNCLIEMYRKIFDSEANIPHVAHRW